MTDSEYHASFLGELMRRRVLRAAAAYVVVAWGIVEVSSVVLPEFNAPEWALRAIIVTLIVGFPPAMLLAWTVDFSLQGFTRTPDSGESRGGKAHRFATVLIAVAISGGTLWWAWDDYILKPGLERQPGVTIKSQPVIAVNSPRQRVGSADNAWLGDGIANLIRGDLAESQHAVVISQSRWLALTSEITDTDALSDTARDIGVDYLVDGEYLETPNGIVLTIYIEDLEAGTQIHSLTTNLADAPAVIAGVPQQSMRIKQALRIPHTENVGTFEADFATGNLVAYEAYIAGLAYWSKLDYPSAEAAFTAAISDAPDYQVARLRLAQVYEETGRTALAWQTLNAIDPDAGMSERLRLYVEGAKSYFVAERDEEQAVVAYRRLVELYPYEFEARSFLSQVYWLNFQDAEAIVEARRLTELHAYDPNSWMQLGVRLLEFGDLEAARAPLQKYVAMQPKDPGGFTRLGNLEQLEGNLSASIEHFESALTFDPGFVNAQSGLAASRYLRGDVDDALSLWQTVVGDDTVSGSTRITTVFDLAGALRGMGRHADAMQVLSDAMPVIEEEGRRHGMALSQQGAIQSEMGNHERAAALYDEALRVAPEPITRYLFAKALAAIQLGEFGNANQLVDLMREFSATDASTGIDADGAASYITGMSALAQGDLDAARRHLVAAVDGIGYRYAIYELGLAQYHRAVGELERAAELARFAADNYAGDYQSSGEMRLDLEIDRSRASLLLAGILAEQGDDAGARAELDAFLASWQGDPQSTESLRAAELAAALAAN